MSYIAIQANDELNPCTESCMLGRDSALCARLSSVVERCPVHAVKGTLAANISYLSSEPLLTVLAFSEPRDQQRDFSSRPLN